MNSILKFFSVCIILSLLSCKEEVDDLDPQCETGCTIINGSLMTDNGDAPISDAKLTLKWDNIPYMGGGTVRRKAIGYTDSNGHFSLKFSTKNDELENGSFYLTHELGPEYYVIPNERIHLNGISRDTVLQCDYMVYRKAFINLKLLHFDEMHSGGGDHFMTDFTYDTPSGFRQSSGGLGMSWNQESPTENLVDVPGNKTLYLKIFKRKNNITTIAHDTLYVNAGQTLDYIIDFNN